MADSLARYSRGARLTAKGPPDSLIALADGIAAVDPALDIGGLSARPALVLAVPFGHGRGMRDAVRLSKFASYVLRHRPDAAGVSLDKEGWLDVDALIEAARRKGFDLDKTGVERLVATSDKKRFTLSEDGMRIRAAQGHSTASVDIGFVPRTPPDTLYHGTALANVASILEGGLHAGRRHYVHLSLDAKTAVSVGRRHGEPVIFVVDAKSMHETGVEFYRADNGVWLTRSVAARFLRLEDRDGG